MYDKQFLRRIGFETCPVTNTPVNIQPLREYLDNNDYRSNKINDHNFITIKRANPEIVGVRFNPNTFAIVGVKNGVCFWLNCLIKDNLFSINPGHKLYIDLSKLKYSEIDFNYFVENYESFVNKNFTDKFSSIKEFWDYLDKFEEFKQND